MPGCAKVFIESQQDAALRHAQFQNFNAGGSRVAVGDPDYIQACIAQRFEGRAREGLIGQEPHVHFNGNTFSAWSSSPA